MRLSQYVKLAVLAFISPLVFAQATGTIRGTISSFGNKAIAGAFVTYHLEQPKAGDATPAAAAVASATDGSYLFKGLIPGRYVVCASATPEAQLVASCEWTLAPFAVSLASGQAVVNANIELQKGTLLEFKVSDPTSITINPKNPQPSSLQKQMLLGVRSPDGIFHHARPYSSDSNGVTYYLVVPKNVDLKVHADAEGAKISDETDGASQDRSKYVTGSRSINAKDNDDKNTVKFRVE